MTRSGRNSQPLTQASRRHAQERRVAVVLMLLAILALAAFVLFANPRVNSRGEVEMKLDPPAAHQPPTATSD